MEPLGSRVDQDLCLGCGLCEISLPLRRHAAGGAPGRGCPGRERFRLLQGLRLMRCRLPPVRAIDMVHFRDKQILAYITMAA